MKNKKPSLQTKAVDRILIDMIKDVTSKGNSTVLILDQYTTSIMSYYVTMSQLLNSGIFSVEPLNANRKSFSTFSVIYFISPTKESAELVIGDFDNKIGPLYNDVHLFFPFRILDSIMEIYANEKIASRIMMMKELNLAFFSNENIFSLRLPDALQTFAYQSSNLSSERKNKLFEIKNKLMTVFASMKEYPYIQYQNTQISVELADLLKGELNELQEQKLLNKERKTICLIVDRSIDLVSPVLHDYSYQSMIYDFFKVNENDCLDWSNEKIIAHKLDEKDELWTKYKHMHLGYVLSEIKADTQKYIESDKSKNAEKNLDDFDKMRKALENRSENQSRTNNLNTHLKLCYKLKTVS